MIKIPSALIVIVHYGDAQVTVRLLESLGKLAHLAQLQVLIVDNGPGTDLRSRLNQFNKGTLQLDYVTPPSNVGYFGGAAHGIRYYGDTLHGLPDWLIISNNDVTLSDELFLEKLFRNDPYATGVLAPSIISRRTMADQNPFMRRRPNRWRLAEWRFWLSNYNLAKMHETLSLYKKSCRGLMTSNSSEPNLRTVRREPIYAPHGSFIIVSRRYFECGGSFGHGAFLYGEELTIAENCRRINLPVVYDPELVVFHDEHQAIGHRFSRASYERHRAAFEYFTNAYFAEFSQ